MSHDRGGPDGERSSARGILFLCVLVGLALAAGCGWMLTREIDPIGGSQWAFGVLATSLIVGPALMLLSGIAVVRHPRDSVAARTGLAANALAMVLGLVLVLR